MKPSREASHRKVSMWQLAIAATKASSGSTFAAFDHGAGTTEGDGEAGTVTPPSNVHVCSREYLPFRKSGPVHFHRIVASCVDMAWRIQTVAGRPHFLPSPNSLLMRTTLPF